MGVYGTSKLTSNMIYIVALSVGLKCPHKIHLNTQLGEGGGTNAPLPPGSAGPTFYSSLA